MPKTKQKSTKAKASTSVKTAVENLSGKEEIKKEQIQEVEKKKTKKTDVKEKAGEPSFYQAVGRRKKATARVKMYVVPDSEVTKKGVVLKKGDVVINGRQVEQYFSGEAFKKIYLEPFRTTNTLGRFAISALIEGGGQAGQLGAFLLGVSRALEKVDKDKFRPILKKRGFLMRDPRSKERRKAGFAQKARAKKQSPKR